MTAVFRFGDFELRAADRQLLRGGTPVKLNARYFDALVLLVSERGGLISKDRFFDIVWKDVVVGDEALTQCMKTLRRVLGDHASEPRFIETVPKHGYRFIPTVSVLDVGDIHAKAPEPAQQPAAVWLARPLALILGGTAGGIVAGLAGGLIYGGVVALGLAEASPGGALMFAAIVALCMLVGGLGALGISLGLAVGNQRGRLWLPILGATLGGLAVGGSSNLVGIDALALLLGVAPERITGAGEGAILGAAAGLAWAAGSLRNLAWRMALACATAGFTAVLAGGTLMAGSLDGIMAAASAADLSFGRLQPLLPTTRLPFATELMLGGLEGLVFGAGLGGGLSLLLQKPLLTQASPIDHANARSPAVPSAYPTAWRQSMKADEQVISKKVDNRWRVARWAGAAALLALPLLAMQFSSEVNWGPGDFIFMAVMLTVFGLLFELSLSWSTSFAYRAGMVVALGTGFLLIWVNAAVGFIGNEENPFNLLYAGVLLVGTLGAALARFEPDGMGRAMFAIAAAQVVVAGIALAAGAAPADASTVLRLLAATSFFAILWLLAAGLFRRAAREALHS